MLKFLLTFIFLLASSMVMANSLNALTIINHYKRPLQFSVDNSTVLVNLPPNFMLEVDSQIKTIVANNQQVAFVRAEDIINSSHNAFFAVGMVNHQIEIHGYISDKVAYSWDRHSITFCTSNDYMKKGSC